MHPITPTSSHGNTEALHNWIKMDNCEKYQTTDASGLRNLKMVIVLLKTYKCSNQSMKCPDEIGNLMWTTTFVLGDVLQNSIGLQASRKRLKCDCEYLNHGRPQGGQNGPFSPMEIRPKNQKFLENLKSAA